MKIKTLTINNVKSFKEKTEIAFDDNLNIFIGPNAGGKSNLFDIINTVFRHYFLHDYRISSQGIDRTIDAIIMDSANLDKHNENNGLQEIEISFKVEKTDIKNIKQIVSHKNEFTSFVSMFKQTPNNNFDNIMKFWTADYPFRIEKSYFENTLLTRHKMNEEDFKFINGVYELDTLTQVYNVKDNISNDNKDKLHAIFSKHDMVLYEGQILKYTIIEKSIKGLENLTPEMTFLHYLRFYNYFLLLLRDQNSLFQLSPLSLYFSPYRGEAYENLQIELPSGIYSQILSAYNSTTSKGTASLIKLATFYFAVKMREFENYPSSIPFTERFKNDEEVKEVTKYFNKFYYEWNVICLNSLNNRYEIKLSKGGKDIFISQASSGEKEIINFVFGMLTVNSRNGIVMIDEPELHIHPKWQRLLIDVLSELAKVKENQLFIVTHSPNFINEKIINYVTRVYTDENSISRIVQIDKTAGQVKDLIHIVNSYNNERIFFADKVILVEGIKDLIVFERYFQTYLNKLKSNQVYEIVEVGGKGNFEKYRKFLDIFKIENFIITDQDYLESNGSDEIKKLFEVDYKHMEEKIKESKSKDGATLVEQIKSYVSNNDKTNLEATIKYLESRHVRLKADLSDDEEKELDVYIKKLQDAKIFVLRKGSIEKYLLVGFRNSLEKVVELTKDENFLPWIKSDEVKGLDEIVYKILDIRLSEKSLILG